MRDDRFAFKKVYAPTRHNRGWLMADYRLHCLDHNGNISLAEWITADTDEEAIAHARQLEHGARKCEVWQQQRLVATIDGQALSS